MTRVTFDPEEAEEALNRSFQPFNDMFIRDTQMGTKRPASSQDHNTLHLSKRFHESNQTYEAQEGYAMSQARGTTKYSTFLDLNTYAYITFSAKLNFYILNQIVDIFPFHTRV